jgi:hypothetical protein
MKYPAFLKQIFKKSGILDNYSVGMGPALSLLVEVASA